MPAVSSTMPAGGEDRLLDDGQAPGGQPVGVGVLPPARTANAPPPIRATTSSPRTVARSRRPISATAVETISRPALSRAAARPSSSISSRVAAGPAPAVHRLPDERRKPARLGSPVIGSV